MEIGVTACRLAALVLMCLLALPGNSAAKGERTLETSLRRHIATLASNEFGGREPGTEGEKLTLRYLAREWFEIGLVSGTNDPGNPWYAPVTLIERTPARGLAKFQRNRRPVPSPPGDILVFTSAPRQLVESTQLLFVGRSGDPLPASSELAGKIAVVIDDPSQADAARGNRLVEAGAAATITILGGERTLEQISAQRERPGYALAGDALGGVLEAFATEALAAGLLGSEWPALKQAVSAPGFKPRLLPVLATLEATTRETRIDTHNLIGKLPGSRSSSGAVLVLAHWDHFGTCSSPPAEDLICNGAVDNASGLAVLTETARLLAKGKKLDRDVYFLATTGEELGLLGAHAFAENPPLPLASITAAFNIDSPSIVSGGLPLTIVGGGRTPLDPVIARVVRSLKLQLVQSRMAEEFLRRQDGWALLQHDVPAVMVSASYSDPARVEKFMEESYHRPSDDYSAAFDISGAVQEVAVQTALVRWFANAKNYPPTGKRR